MEYARRGDGRWPAARLRRHAAIERPRHQARNAERIGGGSAALFERHRRTRPRHRRRRRAGLGHTDRRRAGHRQIDAAAAGRRRTGAARRPRRSISRAKKPSRRCACARAVSGLPTPRSASLAKRTSRTFSRRWRRPAARPRHHRFHPDALGRHARRGAGHRQPGARGGAGADPLRQDGRRARCCWSATSPRTARSPGPR